MAIISPRRFQRSSAQQSEKTQQLVVFEIYKERFALPIKAVFKVAPMGTTYGDPTGLGSSLTVYQGKELMVIDVARHVFGKAFNPPALPAHSPTNSLTEPPANTTAQTTEQAGYLIIARSLHNTFVGLPVPHPPKVRRVPISAFSPLPADYVAKVNIQCVSSLVIEPEKPLLFLLNTEQLTQLQPKLPEMS
ncbi:MAG: chemotaxis protein CheW [Phormidesmis sp.]